MAENTIAVARILVPPASRRRIRLAAAVAGLSVAEFATRAVLERAEELLRGFECGPDLLRELDPAGLARYKEAVADGKEPAHV